MIDDAEAARLRRERARLLQERSALLAARRTLQRRRTELTLALVAVLNLLVATLAMLVLGDLDRRRREQARRPPQRACPACAAGRVGAAICDVCDGLGVVTLRVFAVTLAGRVEPPAPGTPDLERVALARAAYPTLSLEDARLVADAWPRDEE